MNTDRYGHTHINEALKVVSVDARLTEAFAKKGVSPSATLRDKARTLITDNPILTAEQAVAYTLRKVDVWADARTGGGRDVAKYGHDSKPKGKDLGTILIPNRKA